MKVVGPEIISWETGMEHNLGSESKGGFCIWERAIFILRAMELKYTGLKYKKAALFLVQPFA